MINFHRANLKFDIDNIPLHILLNLEL